MILIIDKAENPQVKYQESKHVFLFKNKLKKQRENFNITYEILQFNGVMYFVIVINQNLIYQSSKTSFF